MATTKSIFQSKTFWVNLIAAILGIIAAVDADFLRVIGIPEGHTAEMLVVLGVVNTSLNLILRTLTNTKVILVIAVMLSMAGLSSCAFVRDVQQHGTIEIVQKPVTPNDTFGVVAKFWGMADLVEAHAPKQTKFGKWLTESTRHCEVSIVQFPEHKNDTLAIKLECDSAASTIQGWFKKK